MPSTCPIILFATPDPNARAAAGDALERAGCLTLAAADGAEAVELVRREDGWVDVAVLDLVMPKMGGLAALRRLRGCAPGVSVVLACGNTGGVGGRLLGKRADALLRKPFDRNELFQAVRQGLE